MPSPAQHERKKKPAMIPLCRRFLLLAQTLLLCACATFPASSPSDTAKPAYGAMLEGYTYPAPVQAFSFLSQGETRVMRYMDVKPARFNGRTVVLMHGKNFCAATWKTTIHVLAEQGYRVVAPDQLGFCKSDKPDRYQYSFQQLAINTRTLLKSLEIRRVTLIGHSTGGMLATRYALMFPDEVDQLVLVNPIGLEDWKARGVPYRTVDEWYRRELQTSDDRIRDYEKATYYAGQWRPEYEEWVQMLAGMYRGNGRETMARQSALLYDMIFTQPVLYEFNQLTMPVLLLIGEQDTTAIGRDAAPPEVRQRLGNYPRLAHDAARAIPQATLVTFPELGHAPQIQHPEMFHGVLIPGLATSAEEERELASAQILKPAQPNRQDRHGKAQLAEAMSP